MATGRREQTDAARVTLIVVVLVCWVLLHGCLVLKLVREVILALKLCAGLDERLTMAGQSMIDGEGARFRQTENKCLAQVVN